MGTNDGSIASHGTTHRKTQANGGRRGVRRLGVCLHAQRRHGSRVDRGANENGQVPEVRESLGVLLTAQQEAAVKLELM